MKRGRLSRKLTSKPSAAKEALLKQTPEESRKEFAITVVYSDYKNHAMTSKSLSLSNKLHPGDVTSTHSLFERKASKSNVDGSDAIVVDIESTDIKRKKVEDVWEMSMQEKEKDIISDRVLASWGVINEFRANEIRLLREEFPYLSRLEAEFAYDQAEQKESIMKKRLHEDNYYSTIQQHIAAGRTPAATMFEAREKFDTGLSDKESEDEGPETYSDEDVMTPKKKKKGKNSTHSRQRRRPGSTITAGSARTRSPSPKRTREGGSQTPTRSSPGQRLFRKLSVDEALKQAQAGQFCDMSPARRRVLENCNGGKGVSKNAYYYRFNLDGETQKHGAWSAAEEKLFMARMEQHPPHGDWGIFSIPIPGRVGYQCSNFYRLLLKNGALTDENYAMVDGKLRYIGTRGGKKVYKEQALTGASYHLALEKTKAETEKSGNTNRRRRSSSLSTRTSTLPSAPVVPNPCEMDAFSSASEPATPSATNAHAFDYLLEDVSGDSGAEVDPTNPVPELIDRITLDPVRRPQISPYGHVLGADTWISVLQFGVPKNTCPFTKKPLSKRMLLPLTHDNIEEHRDRMVL